MVKWALLSVITIFISLGTFLYFRLGAYKDPVFHGSDSQSFQLLYKEHVGPYFKINEVISEVEEWALRNNTPCELTFGQYLDDPAKIEEDRLKSLGGCLVNSKTDQLPEGLAYKQLPESNYLKVTFDGSPAIGPFKVYPAVNEWARDNNKTLEGAIIEVYEIKDEALLETTYYFPLAQ